METLVVKVPLQQLHLEHEIWLNELSFYRDELKVLDKYLLEVVTKNSGVDALKGVEHFQNQFIRQKEVLDELGHDIRQHEQLILNAIKNLNPIQAEKGKFEDHAKLRENMDTFKKIYADLKEEFLNFISKWM